jgi:hypothetical protein
MVAQVYRLVDLGLPKSCINQVLYSQVLS